MPIEVNEVSSDGWKRSVDRRRTIDAEDGSERGFVPKLTKKKSVDWIDATSIGSTRRRLSLGRHVKKNVNWIDELMIEGRECVPATEENDRAMLSTKH